MTELPHDPHSTTTSAGHAATPASEGASGGTPSKRGLRLLAGGFLGCFGVLLSMVVITWVVAPRLSRNERETQLAHVQADFARLDAALDAYAAGNGGRYPDALGALLAPGADGRSVLDPHNPPRDPWGKGYGYEAPRTPGAKPRLWTLGRDHREGGEGENADVFFERR